MQPTASTHNTALRQCSHLSDAPVVVMTTRYYKLLSVHRHRPRGKVYEITATAGFRGEIFMRLIRV